MGTKPRKPATPPEPCSAPNELELPERWSVQRKSELVLRLLRGEALDAVSRESQVPAHELESWKRIFLEQGTRGLKTRSDPVIKPDNLAAYLVDFGTAISAKDAKKITGSGYVIGTPGYMAPEQAQGDDVDYRADIYSLGVTLYEALAGKLPALGGYVELAATNEAIPPQIDELILKCLEESRENRLASLRSFVSQLEGALRPSRPLSEVLAHGRLHELAAAIEGYTPREFAKLPAGQRGLILAKVADIVGSGDSRLMFASAQFLGLLLSRGMLLPRDDYREIVAPAVRWAFELEFEGRKGKDSLRRAVEEAASAADGDAHEVLKEEFGHFLSAADFEKQEIWYLHAVREVIEALLANPSCTAQVEVLTQALRTVNQIQRSRQAGSALTSKSRLQGRSDGA